MKKIAVIDLFAGPGGLSEGFSSHTDKRGDQAFDIRISIEKEFFAHQTLSLRALFRNASKDEKSKIIDILTGHGGYDRVKNEFQEQLDQIQSEHSLCFELGKDDSSRAEIKKRLTRALKEYTGPKVLIGGPPCQAYSIIGRTKNASLSGYEAEKDHRHFLYREYLEILHHIKPEVFIMENVKGILSSKVGGEHIFKTICRDLQNPGKALGAKSGLQYNLFSLSPDCLSPNTANPADYILRSEEYGVPQARHRVIVAGLRSDLDPNLFVRLKKSADPVTVGEAIGNLPFLQSSLSISGSTMQDWRKNLLMAEKSEWLRSSPSRVREKIKNVLTNLEQSTFAALHDQPKGLPRKSLAEFKKFIAGETAPSTPFNHESRTHMASDLHRYLFAACYGDVEGRSPVMPDYPEQLLPNHRNASTSIKAASAAFADRFRVQLANKPSTTVTCHISRDGHYYIHPDPRQCRSLTVREAARLQTFPDNYFFCGPRTAQYVQVGNAVPPLLAGKIAACIHETLLHGATRG